MDYLKPLLDLISNVSAELVAGIIGFIFAHLVLFLRNRLPLKNFLGEFVNDQGTVHIYFGSHELKLTNNENLQLLQDSFMSSTIALGYIQHLFMSYRLANKITPQTQPTPVSDDSFVIIGFEHPLAQNLMQQPYSPITKVDKSFLTEKDSYEIKHTSGNFLRSVEDWHLDMPSDGFIIRFPFYKNTKQTVLLIGGFGSQGTAAAGYFLWKNWRKIHRKVGNEPFICRVSIEHGLTHVNTGEARFLQVLKYSQAQTKSTVIRER